MGRAKGGNVVAGAVTGRRQNGRISAHTCTLSVRQLIDNDFAYARAGEQLPFASELYTLQEDDPAAGMLGLDTVKSVQRLPNGLYRVGMGAFGSAIVDLNGPIALAHSAGDDASEADRLGALYAAMGHKAMYETDPDTTEPDSPLAALGDAYAALEERSAAQHDHAEASGPTPAMLAELALAAQAQLLAAGEDITISPENLNRLLTPEEPASTNTRAAARLAMSNWRATVRKVIASAEAKGDDVQRQAARALLFHYDSASGELAGALTEATQEEYAQAATELGCPVPELKIRYDENGISEGDFEVGSAEKERIDIIRNALSYGDRSFAFRGPPGSGKGEMASQLAAIMGCAFVPINVGPSNDLEQNIGGDGLRSETVTVDVPILGADNKPVLGANKKPLTYPQQTVVTVSKTLYGPLAEAARRPCIIEIQEPEGMEQEAIRLHSLLGEKVGEPAKRYLNINSSAAGTEISIPVHPDCIIIFTYNAGKEDVKLKQATHDRCVNLDFDYPTKEAECRRLAKMVNRVLRDPNNNVPDGLRRELEPEVMKPFVGVVEKMRNIARENSSFIEEPGSRTAARLCLQMMFQAFQGDNRGDRTARLLLDYCRSYDEKTTSAPDSLVNQVLSDELTPLQALNDMWYNEGALSRGEEPLDAAAEVAGS